MMRTTQTQGRKGDWYAAGAAFLILLIAAMPAMAVGAVPDADLTELSIEDLMSITVSGASKFEQTISEAPSSVSMMTSSDIKKQGYRTLADILRSLPGFYVTYDRSYSYIGVRGFGRPGDYNSRVLLLIDGHRINDNVYNQAMIGTEFILDVDLIDRVEIIRGPGSSLYGSNAVFGVINVITKRGRDLKGAEVSGEAGSFAAYKGRLSYGNRYPSGVEAIASASAYDSKGDRLFYAEYDSPATNNGVTDNTDYNRYQSLFTNVSFGDWTLQGAYSSRTKGIPTGAYFTDFNDPQNKTTDIRSYGELKYEHGLGAKADLTARLFYDYVTYEGTYVYYQDPDRMSVNKDSSAGSWWGGELRVAGRIGDLHRLVAGAEIQDNLRQDQESFYVGLASPAPLDDARRSTLWAAYVQDEITFSRSLILNAGVRYDHYDSFGGATNPRIALIAKPAEKSTVKVLYGTAFRAPNNYELYYAFDTQSANPDLRPEKITTTEVVYDQHMGDHVRASLAGYYYRIRDLIDYGSDPVDPNKTQFQNISEVTAKGAEAEVAGRWATGVEARISYTVQRTEDRATGEPLTNSPAQMGKLVLNVPVIKQKLFLGIEEQYMDRRKTDAGGYAPSFAITNLTLFAQDLIPRLEASVSVYNLFDKEYGDPVTTDFRQPTIQQDGRTFRLKLTYRF